MSGLILKFKFISTNSLTFGTGLIVFNENGNAAENKNCVVLTEKSEIDKVNLKESVEEFKKTLFKLTLLNDILNNVVMLGINDELKRACSNPNYTKKVADFIKAGDKTSVEYELKELILNVVEAEFIIETYFGDNDSKNNDYDIDISEAEILTENIPEIELDGKAMTITPVMDPVKGVEIAKLTVGDEIYVKITDESDFAQELRQRKNASDDDGNIIPILADFYSFQKEDEKGEGFLIVKIEEKIYGRCKEYKTLKVRRFKLEKQEEDREEIEIKSDGVFWFAVFLIIIFAGALAVYMLFSFF